MRGGTRREGARGGPWPDRRLHFDCHQLVGKDCLTVVYPLDVADPLKIISGDGLVPGEERATCLAAQTLILMPIRSSAA